MSATFTHLHLHTEYSLADGLVRVKSLVQRAAELGMPAVAVTEKDNLFSLVKFYKAAMDAGVQPIVGADLMVRGEDPNHGDGRMLFLVQDNDGYRNLCRLMTRAYSKTRAGDAPVIDPAWLVESQQGLIAVSAGRHGVLGRTLLGANERQLGSAMDWWRQCFGDRFYLEVVRTGRENEENYIDAAVDAAVQFNVPLVAGNDVCFLEQDDFDAHEARVCIHEGRGLTDPRRTRRYSDQQYLRSQEEMSQVFEDLPQALENSVEIARRCNVEIRLGESFLP
ncbi:MAG: DNA polymerase-3 subunit alpha, partial [Gammaproteobacteria bacterium]